MGGSFKDSLPHSRSPIGNNCASTTSPPAASSRSSCPAQESRPRDQRSHRGDNQWGDSCCLLPNVSDSWRSDPKFKGRGVWTVQLLLLPVPLLLIIIRPLPLLLFLFLLLWLVNSATSHSA